MILEEAIDTSMRYSSDIYKENTFHHSCAQPLEQEPRDVASLYLEILKTLAMDLSNLI